MKQVYIVTSGSYSDYGIVSVWSTKEAAEKVAKAMTRKNDDADVEEWTLHEPDDATEMISRRIFLVRISQAGEVVLTHEYGPYYTLDAVDETVRKNGNVEWDWIVDVRADNEEHACRIAFDRIAQHKAVEAGIV
jgi:hypothetical protein